MSELTHTLKELGFYCGIEQELYLQDTGQYTSLIIEGIQKGSDVRYDFYKQTFYPRYPNSVTVYGEQMTEQELVERVKRYLLNRRLYLQERNDNL
ncbi:hypothetical protein E1X98_00255 [Listeria monocytogenes]|uniref:hypothetical protein n=1 Tax=Listeria monocytogenes TaxID=1639 RepID=UPI0010E51169|nr:hypothetical protein [Listeria monocytogenes]EAE2793850.1 hypothetical protein [Listeria monocytogenes]EAE4464072.1 hypothetical protein [Listeria monocytogenes]HCO9085478.1 hypothetical protein [Listeria monocytogenes]